MTDPETAAVLPSALERLAARGPFEPQERDLMVYGRLVGGWDVAWARLDVNGEAVERRRGEWHFAWVLGGRAVQDVIWTVGEPPENDGTTLRCWDPQLGAWRVVFMSPADRQFVTLVGRADGDGIVQDVVAWDRPERAGASERWRFCEMTLDGFVWRAEISRDGGRTWTITHEVRATRQRT